MSIHEGSVCSAEKTATAKVLRQKYVLFVLGQELGL